MSVPMQEPTFAILTALVDEPLHGYAIITAVAEATGGEVRLLPGTLYTALERMRDSGLLEVDSDEIVNGRRRRGFRLTIEGRDALGAEAERRRDSAQRALDRLRVSRPAVAR